MTEKEIESAIRLSVAVSPQKLTLSKAIILELAKTRTTSLVLIQEVLDKNGVVLKSPVVFGIDDSADAIKTVSTYLSWHVATCEAILSLVHAGLLFGAGEWCDGLSSIHWQRVR
jgi:hypothetical protein